MKTADTNNLINPITRAFFLVLFIALTSLQAFGQTQNECQLALRKAQRKYALGMYPEMVRVLRPCLEKDLYDNEGTVQAYELLAGARFSKKETAKSKALVGKIFKLKPNYIPKPHEHARAFIQFVEFVRPREKKSKKWLWLGGGGLVTVGVISYFVLKNNDDERLPDPPALP